MVLPDSALKRALGRYVPGIRGPERRNAAFVYQAPFRKQFLVSRRNVARCATSRRTVMFGPDFPLASDEYVIIKVLLRLGLRATSGRWQRAPEAVFAWRDSTVVSADKISPLISSFGRVINGGCLDIGKDRVEQVHQNVFGYGLAVDPRAGGTYLRKSTKNATHDARIFEAPREPMPGFVYQRPIQTMRGSLFEEIRLPYVGACLPVCILKTKAADRRFEGMPGFADLEAVEALRPYFGATAVSLDSRLTAGETERVDRFAKEMGLDCGELDVIRDEDSGRLHVIDVNKTPCGPTIVLSSSDMRRYLDAYADAVEALLRRFPVR